ncbi:hypothetical protein CDL12_25128 [Handroanthus impetiginosus]|uniref:Uncharacterized protein n=1 Tax=Handroanthus impetiginosus TaxID=429701 RepID=A0A2G9GBJ8_9LAMI|nr:hypothetical protein CDL12_25128 [Handroanthus impetiginosus]
MYIKKSIVFSVLLCYQSYYKYIYIKLKNGDQSPWE